MDPIVDLAPGTEESLLAPYFAERIRDALASAKQRRTFFSLKSAVFVVDFDSGDSVTLRFDHGRLTIHQGSIGIPTITFGGPLRALLSLHLLRPSQLFKSVGRSREVTLAIGSDARQSSPPPSFRGRVDAAELLRLFFRDELKIYGLLAHPRTVVRFLTLLRGADRT